MKIFNCALGLALVATAAAVGPSGTYAGGTSKMGEHVSGTVTISDDGATFDGNIVGKGLVPVDITCNAEQFTVGAKGKINLPTVGTAGDCLHDGLQKYSVKLKEVDYDAKKDTITLHVKDIIPITIVLQHQAVAATTTAPTSQSMNITVGCEMQKDEAVVYPPPPGEKLPDGTTRM